MRATTRRGGQEDDMFHAQQGPHKHALRSNKQDSGSESSILNGWAGWATLSDRNQSS